MEEKERTLEIRKKVVIDCDPGVDDAFALLLCLKHMEVLAITAVGGNTGIEFTKKNACYILELTGFSRIPVYAGCDMPLKGEIVRAPAVHGQSGLGNIVLPSLEKKPEEKDAVDYLMELYSEKTDVSLIALGPLTNIATALQRKPEIAKNIPELLIMGGSAFSGNVTATAEFNIYVDPEAAKIVLDSGIPIKMLGLNTTRQNAMGEEEAAIFRKWNTKVGDFCAELLEFVSKSGATQLCDACTVAWAIRPEIIRKSVRVKMDVETEGKLTRGMTVCDWRKFMERIPELDISHSMPKDAQIEEANVELAMEMDIAEFRTLFLETIKSYQ